MRHARSAVLSRIKKLLTKERLMQASSNGEISVEMLEELSQHTSGWVGRISQSLLMAFSQPPTSYAAAEYLEQAAAQLISWATEIRESAAHSAVAPAPGSVVMVRLPNHFPTFEAIIEGEDRAYVPLLDQSYPITDILIVPKTVKVSPSKTSARLGLSANTGMKQTLEKKVHQLHALRFSPKA